MSSQSGQYRSPAPSIFLLMKRISAGLLLTPFAASLPKTDIMAIQRFRLFRTITFFACLIAIQISYQVCTTGEYKSIVTVTIGLLFLAIFVNYFLLPVHRNAKVAYGAMLIMAFLLLHVISYKQGGVRNSGLFNLGTLILGAFMSHGKRGGLLMTVAAVANLIYFYFVNTYTDWVDYSLIGDDLMINLDFMVTGGLSVLLLAGLADHIRRTNNAVTTDIAARRDEMAAKNEELLRAQKDLETKNSELLQKNKELEQFAYVASHDLQEPLRIVSDFVHLFQKKYDGTLDPKAARYLSFIAEGSERMQLLIHDLLQFSMIGHQREWERVNCDELLSEVCTELGVTIHESGARIETGFLPEVTGYRAELKLLFQHLLENAIKFRHKHTAPRIRIKAEALEKGWRFSISDNGIGIPSAYYERIFIIFQRLHTRSEYTGSGIGLAHCKKIVELHRGKIWLESEPGKGTTFYFTIPLRTL